ncbi:hypothetical protein OIV83_005049 [Microbotryomycetes sp. JL201]|nr:hypothetical protein OIV83_005049 [Microbotryomycetes sp. JL201]
MMNQSNSSYSSLASDWTQSTAPPRYTSTPATTNPMTGSTKSSSKFVRLLKKLVEPAPESVPQPGETAMDVINRLNKRHGAGDVQALHYKR